jgi:hypothetical protein
VRRLIALSVIAAVLELAGLSALLHTHVYENHAHPEHRHGLAAHTHDEPQVRADDHDRDHDHDAGAAWSQCDPGSHETSVQFVSSAPISWKVPFAPVEHAFELVVGHRATPPLAHLDVRTHGPPTHSSVPSRAPPLIALQSIT